MTLTEHARQGHQLTAQDAEKIEVMVCVMRNHPWLGEVWEFPGLVTLRRDQLGECSVDFTRDDFGRKRDIVGLVDEVGEPVFTLTRATGHDGYRADDEGTRQAVKAAWREEKENPPSN